jgi:hypothetical protein
MQSHLPKGKDILYLTPEVPPQEKNSNVIEGGWVGGDAWFGSIESCFELMRFLKLHSSFIIKQNLNNYPIERYYSLRA